MVVLMPGVLITFLSFAVFWSDSASADALGYGIGVVIINLLSSVVLMELLPRCGETLWIDMFSFLNIIFCCMALFQSAFSIMLENYDGDHIVFTFIVVGCTKIYSLFCGLKNVPLTLRRMPHTGKASTTLEPQGSLELLSGSKYVIESVASILYRQYEREPMLEAEETGPEDLTNEQRLTKLVFFESALAHG